MEGPQSEQGIPVVSLETLNVRGVECGATVVDLRSPSEYGIDHVPGAVNVPLLDDEERAVVGTLYHREGREVAFREGRDAVRRRIVDLVGRILDVASGAWSNKTVANLEPEALVARVEELTSGGMARLEAELVLRPAGALPEGSLILCCWRGGLRSRSLAALLLSLGFEGVVVLDGGYRSWRKAVRAGLASFTPEPGRGTFVLRGLTGVGKTLVLREVERLRPGWTVDLEGLAGHRSSLLGMVGLEPVSQKTFETALWMRLLERGAGPLVLEGESRKVGDVEVPLRLWEALCGGENLVLEAPLKRRVEVLVADYLAPATDRDQLRRQLEAVARRMRPENPILSLWEAGEVEQMVRELLLRYYDPLYLKGEKGRVRAATLDATDPLQAAQSVVSFVEA
jgi:tRNA 2-selenouridine synthase